MPNRPKTPEQRARHNEYLRDYQARRYQTRRAEAIAILGGSCVHCGSTDSLQFDHIDREEKSFSIAKRLTGAPWKVIVAELQKCQLLCEPCHAVKTHVVERDESLNNPRLAEHFAQHGAAS